MNTTDPVDLEALRGFTPGPWEVDSDGAGWYIEAIPERGHSLACISSPAWQDEPDTSVDEAEANAALIAAAPSMHAELLARRARDAEAEALVARWRRYANDVTEEDATDEAVAGALNGCADELSALIGAKS